MGASNDVGALFERLKRRGRGGRRSDEGAPASSGARAKEVLRDALDRGRRTVDRTTERVYERARRRRVPERELPPEGVVQIEYSPRLDGDPDPGEVVWAWVPFEEDPDQGKDRPVVIVGRRGRGLVGVPLTTKRSNREAQIALGTGPWDPKRRQSYARIWRMLDVDPDRMRREGAVLDRRRFDEVVAAVDQYYEVRRTTTVAADADFEYDD